MTMGAVTEMVAKIRVLFFIQRSIIVGTMAGNSDRSFSGTFDGGSDTLTFNSSDCNYATRFNIVFDEEATNDIVDNFAYVSNGNDTKTQKIVIE